MSTIALVVSAIDVATAGEERPASPGGNANPHEVGAMLGLTPVFRGGSDAGIREDEVNPLVGLQWRLSIGRRPYSFSGVYVGAEAAAQYYSRWTLDLGLSTRPSFGFLSGAIVGYEFGVGGSSFTIAPELRTDFVVIRRPIFMGDDVWPLGVRQTLGPALRHYFTPNWVLYLAPLSAGYQALTEGLGTAGVFRVEMGFAYRFRDADDPHADHAPDDAVAHDERRAEPITHEIGAAIGLLGLSHTIPGDILPALTWRVHVPSEPNSDPYSGFYFGIEAGPQYIAERPWPGFTGGMMLGYELAPGPKVGFTIAPDVRLGVTIFGVETEAETVRTSVVAIGSIGPLFRFYPERKWTFHVLPLSLGAAVQLVGSAPQEDVRFPVLRTECGVAYRF